MRKCCLHKSKSFTAKYYKLLYISMSNVEPVRGMHWDADYKLRYTTYKLNISILTCGSAMVAQITSCTPTKHKLVFKYNRCRT